MSYISTCHEKKKKKIKKNSCTYCNGRGLVMKGINYSLFFFNLIYKTINNLFFHLRPNICIKTIQGKAALRLTLKILHFICCEKLYTLDSKSRYYSQNQIFFFYTQVMGSVDSSEHGVIPLS